MKLHITLLSILFMGLISLSSNSLAQLYTPGGVGNVQTSTSGLLEFKHNVSDGGIKLIRNSTTTFKNRLTFFQNSNLKWLLGVDRFENNSNNFYIWGNGSMKFFIDGSGKTGLNTETPEHLLHVVGGGVFVKETTDPTLDNDGPGADLTLESNVGARLNINAIAQEGMINLYGGATRLSLLRYSAASLSVCIGNVDPVASNAYRLYVEKGILTEKLKIAIKTDVVNWSDFVFEEDYKLMPLCEVEAFVKTNHHLPEIPSADEVYKDGLDVAQMDAKLLQKIEELTLYMIALEKKNIELQKRVSELEQKSNLK